MKQTISSSLTFIYKFIFSALWITGFGFGTFMSFSITDKGSAVFCVMFVLGTLFIYWGCIRLKSVSIDEEFLYISNYFTEIKVHRSEISKVTENVFINTNPVWIHFKHDTEFGEYIMFMPKTRYFSFFSSHPVVKELKRKIGA